MSRGRRHLSNSGIHRSIRAPSDPLSHQQRSLTSSTSHRPRFYQHYRHLSSVLYVCFIEDVRTPRPYRIRPTKERNDTNSQAVNGLDKSSWFRHSSRIEAATVATSSPPSPHQAPLLIKVKRVHFRPRCLTSYQTCSRDPHLPRYVTETAPKQP